MKMNYVFPMLLLLTGFMNTSEAQDKAKAKSIPEIVWYGVDFTHAKFTAVAEDPAVIVNQYLKSINAVIIAEPDKYNIKKFFNKTGVTNSPDRVNENNLKINPAELVISNEYTIEPEKISKIVKNFIPAEKSGTGLIFIAENLNKSLQTGSYYECFFDIATREIIDSRREVAKAVGIGFRNYWAGSVYGVMKAWSEEK